VCVTLGCATTPAAAPPTTSSNDDVRVPSWAQASAKPSSEPIAFAPPLEEKKTTSLGTTDSPKSTFHGAKLDLDVKNADIHDLCRLLADVGHVNIVVADDVKGSVTLKLKGVPWDEVLDLVAKMKGFRVEYQGSVIAVYAK